MRLPALAVVLTALCLTSLSAHSEGWMPPTATTPAERSILRDLYQRYTEDRTGSRERSRVRPEFLRKVLMAPRHHATDSPPFVHVRNAFFGEHLILDGVRSNAYLEFDDCVFLEGVNI